MRVVPFIAAAAMVAVVGTASADVVYSWTTETGNRFNPGPAVGGVAQRIAFDDVLVTQAAMGGMPDLLVTSVTVGIRRAANALPVDVNLYWANFEGDTYAAGALTQPNFVQQASLAQLSNPGFVTELVNFSNPAGLFTVTPNFGITAAPNFGGFFLGIQFSHNNGTVGDQDSGWRIVSGGTAGANFTGAFMLWDPDTNVPPGPVAFQAPTPSAFYIVVEGTPIPAPGSLALLATGGLLALRRRR